MSRIGARPWFTLGIKSKCGLLGVGVANLKGKLTWLWAPSFTLMTLVLSLSLSWVVLAQVNFLYPVWHDHAGIGAGIEKYGPQNRYKIGFADTSSEQRFKLFSEINSAIHNGGDGLGEIRYSSASSEGAQQLLHRDEIVHLQDVAALIDVLRWFCLFNSLFWLAFVYWGLMRGGLALKWRAQLISMISLVSLSSILVLALGPKRVFNQLHIWVFPDDHKWFFYYQDSLMSTMMLAPNLFAWIAISLVFLAIVFYCGLIWCVKKLIN